MSAEGEEVGEGGEGCLEPALALDQGVDAGRLGQSLNDVVAVAAEGAEVLGLGPVPVQRVVDVVAVVVGGGRTATATGEVVEAQAMLAQVQPQLRAQEHGAVAFAGWRWLRGDVHGDYLLSEFLSWFKASDIWLAASSSLATKSSGQSSLVPH